MEDLDMARRKQVLEVLSCFLQNTKSTVEQLYEGHTVASMQSYKQRRTAGAGIPAVVDKEHPQETLDYQAPCKLDHWHRWHFASRLSTSSERVSERRSDYSSERTGFGSSRFSEAEMDRAILFFLNDMRKTVDSWCARYRILAEGKNSFVGMPQPLSSDLQVVSQLGFEADVDHNISVLTSLDDRDNEVLHPYAQNRQIIAKPFAKKVPPTTKRVKHKSTVAHRNRKQLRASGCFSKSTPDGLNSVRTLDLSQQMKAGQESVLTGAQLGGKNLDSDGHTKNVVSGNHGIATVKFNSFDPNEKSSADIESPLQTDELTIRPHCYNIEVVENPDWLPKGWITELKTRSTGGSAGCKDKYFYDPVSKRRCRSQKEVFCFLETGKLGRYKRKQPANKLLGLDLEQQVSNASEMHVSEKEEAPFTRSGPQPYCQENMPGPLGIFSGAESRGWGSGTFLPYRPGQTADVLYDSLTNLSRPGLDQYRYMEPMKTGADKSFNASRPWFLDNSEVSTGPLIERKEMDNVIEQDGPPGFGRGSQNVDTLAKRARKSTKRAVG